MGDYEFKMDKITILSTIMILLLLVIIGCIIILALMITKEKSVL